MAQKIGGFLGLLAGFIVWKMIGGITGLLVAILLVVPIASGLFIGLFSAISRGSRQINTAPPQDGNSTTTPEPNHQKA